MTLSQRLRPLWMTAVVALPVGCAVALLVEEVYGVPLSLENLRWERPDAWPLLLAAPLVLWVRGFAARKRMPRLQVSRFTELAALSGGYRRLLPPLLSAMRVVALLLIGGALMGPQSIHARNSTEVQGIDIVVAMDLSLSMQAADIKPNRFTAGKQVVDSFIRRRHNDRVGAVIFGREAYTLLPLTTDHESLRTLITELQLEMIDGRGTAIGNAIGVALNRLRKSDAKSRVVILLTDGQSNSGNVSPLQSAEFAKALDVKVYTVLMGRSDEAPMQQGTDLFGRPVFDRGNFPINPELLRKVATETGAEAFQVEDREALERSFHTILDRLEKSDIDDAGRTYGELFPALLGPGLLLVFIEALLGLLLLRRWP